MFTKILTSNDVYHKYNLIISINSKFQLQSNSPMTDENIRQVFSAYADLLIAQDKTNYRCRKSFSSIHDSDHQEHKRKIQEAEDAQEVAYNHFQRVKEQTGIKIYYA